MELWLAALIIVGAAVLSAAGMLIVRRRAGGNVLQRSDSGGCRVHGGGTAYMVIVAFVFFIAFESYRGAKADAEEEATATLAMFHAAGPFGPAARADLQGQMICYARGDLGRLAGDAGR